MISTILYIANILLLIVIPLVPKIPIFDVLPGYIVRARIEDLLLLIIGTVWFFALMKRKVEIHTLYIWFFIAFAFSGTISLLSGVLLQQSIPTELLHIGKSGLHFFRYLEYFSLFVLSYSVARSTNKIDKFIIVISLVVIAISVYGFGQIFWKFPVYSTMNREYSKGVTLYLQENARPQSTFAGHYDLAAYMVIVLPIIIASIFTLLKEEKSAKIGGIVLHSVALVSGGWMLIASESKTAIIACFSSILIVLLLHLPNQYLVRRLFASLFVIFLILLGSTYYAINYAPENSRLGIQEFTAKSRVTQKVFTLLSADQNNDNTTTATGERPSDLYGEGHEFKRVATESADGVLSYIDVPTTSIWSPNALRYGISMGIRLDTLWPNAIKGFFNNPIVGNGFATLSRVDSKQFTEADSTDNNYLRMLGELGIVGFVIFFGTILVLLHHVTLLSNKQASAEIIGLRYGFVASIIGICINALYIDVFAASKVAMSFWLIAGMVIGQASCDDPTNSKAIIPLKIADLNSKIEKRIASKIVSFIRIHLPLIATLTVLLVLWHQNPFAELSALKNFDAPPTLLEPLLAARCFVNTGQLEVCSVFDSTQYKDHFSLYSVLLIPFALISRQSEMYYYLNLLIILTSVVLIYSALHFSRLRDEEKIHRYYFFTTLVIVLGLLFRIHTQPMNDALLLLFMFFLPTIALFSIKMLPRVIMDKIKGKEFLFLFFVATVLILQAKDVLRSFRNNELPLQYKAIERANLVFDDTYHAVNSQKTYFATSIHPYRVALHSNKHYEILPMGEIGSGSFSQFTPSPSDTFNLVSFIENALQQNQNIFISNFNSDNSEQFSKLFSSIKRQFTLRYRDIDCMELCNIYRVLPDAEPKGDTFYTILGDIYTPSFNLNTFSMQIFPTRFDSEVEHQYTHTTKSFAQRIIPAMGTSATMSWITGDVGNNADIGQWTYFSQLIANSTNHAVLYNPGNIDIFPQKHTSISTSYMFDESLAVISLTGIDKGAIHEDEQIALYNIFLSLEKLPNISHVIVIAHDLDWQNPELINSFTPLLERRMAELKDLTFYIFTNNHYPDTTSNSTFIRKNSEANWQYFASSIEGNANDTWMQFSLNSQGEASVTAQPLLNVMEK